MLKLSKSIQLKIETSEGLFSQKVQVRTLTKKQRQEVQGIVFAAQDIIDENQAEALLEIERASKLRFEYTIDAGEKQKDLVDICEEYGYNEITSEIDELISKGK